ncbi:50S ribosomal protein L23 [Candidatus Parcubacteria bacterium]|nr:50S ribosomal protein L23 [Candidatus Parcubacteria bacterium]
MGILNRFKKKQEQQALGPDTKAVEQAPVASKAAVKAGAVDSRVVIAPIVTEKSAYLAAQGQYVFEVERSMNKVQVRDAIRVMYGVLPLSVNMVRQRGKKVRFGRTQGKRKGWKKAIVTLPKGKTIEVYEGV